MTISIPYTPTESEMQDTSRITAYHVDGSGNFTEMEDAQYIPSEEAVVFTTSHFSYYAVGYKFIDVHPNAWYYEAVTFIANRGITKGTGGGKFSPEAKLTRGQFITLLLRAYEFSPDVKPADNFADAGNTYYTGYLAAAKRLDIAKGVGNNRFAPEQAITRQEMFTLLYNALKVLDKIPAGDTGKNLADFTDGAAVADWAREAVNGLVKAGMVVGSDNRLDPLGGSTRAQMAQVLYKLLSE